MLKWAQHYREEPLRLYTATHKGPNCGLLSGNRHLAEGPGKQIRDIPPTFSTVVLDGIAKLARRCLTFRYSVGEQANIKAKFAAMLSSHILIRAIECTHIVIKASSVNEAAFISRKQFCSINVQVVSDAGMTLKNVVARWPGSSYDSFILSRT